MTVRAYLRVSSQQQAEQGHSLQAQRTKAEAWATYQGLSPIQYYEDAGISGKRDDRPALLNLVDDIEAGDTVLVYSLSRLGRGGAVQLLGLVRDIELCGARLVSLTENIDTKTPAGRLLLTVLAALTEMEVEVTKERVLAGRIQAAQNGMWPHADNSLGFGWRRNAQKRVEIDPEGAEVVRHMFDLAAQGMSYAKIAQTMIDEGIPPRFGGKWTHQTVQRIIKMRAYCSGELLYQQRAKPNQPDTWVSIPAPAIISEAVWEAAQRNRSSASSYKQPEIYPLTTHLVCGCGTGMHGVKSRRHTTKKGPSFQRLYGCMPDRRGSHRCPVHGRVETLFRVDDINQMARTALVEALGQPEFIRAILTPAAAQLDPHRLEREQLERRRTALIDLHLEGMIDRAEFEQRRDDLGRRITQLQPQQFEMQVDDVALGEYQQAAQHLEGPDYLELLRELRVQFVVEAGPVVRVKSLSVPQK